MIHNHRIRKSKKLVLRKESIVQLNVIELSRARGGLTGGCQQQQISDDYTACATDCR